MVPDDAAYVVVLHATRLVPFEHWKPTCDDVIPLDDPLGGGAIW